MSKLKIVQAALLLAAVVIFSSCSSGRQYRSYPPPPPGHTSVSLIISNNPGLVISRYADGRYYYRAPGGYIYWRGYGNRYYLDRRYVNRSYLSHRQYRDWNRHYRRR